MHERRDDEEESGEKIAFNESTMTDGEGGDRDGGDDGGNDGGDGEDGRTTRDSSASSASTSTKTTVKKTTVDADAGASGTRRETTKKRATTYAAYGGAATIGTYALYRVIRWALGRDDHGTFGSVPDRRFSATHRKCNRCGARGSQVRVKCERCKRCWYCSKECKKAAWSMEICECC